MLENIPRGDLAQGPLAIARRQFGIEDEERVGREAVGVDQGVALGPAEFLERRDAGAVVVGAVPNPIGVVGDGARLVDGEEDVVLDDHHPGREAFEGFPNPILVAVDIDGEQVEAFGDAVLGEERVDVARVNEFALDDFAVGVVAALHEQALPAVVQAQVGGVGEVLAIPGAELDEVAALATDHIEDAAQYAVLSALGVDAGFVVGEIIEHGGFLLWGAAG